MELYLKQHLINQRVLQKYPDLSQKVIALQKKNNKPILTKAYPTSKQCIKFTMQSMMEMEMDSIPELVNVIQQANGHFNWSEHVLIVISSYRNYKNDEVRLVLRGSGFGTGELISQKKVQILPDEDLSFDDDIAEVSAVDEEEEGEGEKWVDEWGNFSFKKSDDLLHIATELSCFYHDVTGNACGKKRKAKSTSTTSQTQSKKKKNAIINQVNQEEQSACELKIDLNKLNPFALAELMYFYSSTKTLNLEDCICRYNDEMNENLNSENKVDFVSLINTSGFEQIRCLVEQLK